jgi:hypothetical protein
MSETSIGQFQPALDFTGRMPAAIQAKIAEGMQRSDEHADHGWKRVVDGCILAVARRRSQLSVDDVLDELDRVNAERKAAGQPIIATHDLAALGPAMKRAMRDKFVSPTNAVIRSKRAEKHGNRHSLWKSNFCEAAENQGS